jgi:hypothetical protein
VFIHNQCSDFELVSQVYFGHNAIWIRTFDQKLNDNTTTGASFGKDMTKYECASVLIYKLQRKNHRSNNQSNSDSTFVGDSSTSLQFLIIWKLDEEHRICVRALLIKHSNSIIWNEDTLEKLYSMLFSLCKASGIIEDTWLLDDAIVLMTAFNWEEENHRFEITISEGTREDGTMEPLWISLNM